MTLETLLTLLLVVSILTGLATEGIKVVLKEANKRYAANALAGAVSVVLSMLVGIGYIVVIEAAITAQMVVYLIALVLLSWLVAMLGYDKVVQTITQVISYKRGK